jgi:hypothetical protein
VSISQSSKSRCIIRELSYFAIGSGAVVATVVASVVATVVAVVVAVVAVVPTVATVVVAVVAVVFVVVVASVVVCVVADVFVVVCASPQAATINITIMTDNISAIILFIVIILRFFICRVISRFFREVSLLYLFYTKHLQKSIKEKKTAMFP